MNQDEFREKKLMVLGNSVSSCEIIQIAKELGAYTIAVDYLEDSEFKRVADKSYNISTADIDALAEMAQSEGVNGVLAGASEFNIDKAIDLCNRLGLPFYATRKQWDILSNKDTFKKLCRKFDVPVVDEYADAPGLEKTVRYPVIIKPVDGCAGQGISVCKDEEEFLSGRQVALDCSDSKRLIIERYMTGDEVVIYYTIQDGYVSLSAMCDRHTLRQEGVAPLPTAYIYPSKFLEDFQKYDDTNVRRMFKSLNIQNGFLFIQAFVEEGRIRIYEMGFRIAGAQGHKPIAAVNGVNPLVMLVRHALSGKMSGWDLKTQDDPNFKKYACKLTPILKKGTIGRIEGLEMLEQFSFVTDIVPVHEIGDRIDSVGTLKQLLSRIYLVTDSRDDMKSSINLVQNTLKAFDEQGQDLLMPGFDVALLH